MTIEIGSLHFRYTGSASTTNPSSFPQGSTIVMAAKGSITSGTINNVFDDVTGDESQTGDTEYRCIGIWNDYPAGSYNWMNTSIRITGALRATSFDVISIATEQPTGSGSGTLQSIADESTGPSTVTFQSQWVSESAGAPGTTSYIAIGSKTGTGTIYPQEWGGIWIRRVVPGTADAYNNRACTIEVKGESSASPLTTQTKLLIANWDRGKFYWVLRDLN